MDDPMNDRTPNLVDTAAHYPLQAEEYQELSKAIVKAMPRIMASWVIAPNQLAAMLAMTPERIAIVANDRTILLTSGEVERGEHVLALHHMTLKLYGSWLSQCWVHQISMAEGYRLRPAIALMMGTTDELAFVRRDVEADLLKHPPPRRGRAKG